MNYGNFNEDGESKGSQYEQYLEAQQKRKDKKKRKEKSKWVSQSIIGVSLLILVVGAVSITEIGCGYYQEYIDKAVVPVINGRKASGLIDIEEFMDDDGKFDVKNCKPIQKALEEKFRDTIYPNLQWRVAKMHHFFERNYWAYKAFGKYNTWFGWDKEKRIEAEYLEIKAARDAYQYKTCDKLLDLFIENYEDDSVAARWYKDVLDIKEKMNLIPKGKRLTDEAYY